MKKSILCIIIFFLIISTIQAHPSGGTYAERKAYNDKQFQTATIVVLGIIVLFIVLLFWLLWYIDNNPGETGYYSSKINSDYKPSAEELRLRKEREIRDGVPKEYRTP